MAKRVVDETSLTAVADAIRERAGTSEPLVFPEGFKSAVESVPDYLDQRMTGTIVEYENNLSEDIPQYMFYSCKSIQKVSFPNTTVVGIYAFWNCTSLQSVNLPSVTHVGTNGFQNCTALKEIVFPQCTSLGIWAFNASGLEVADFLVLNWLDGQSMSGTNLKVLVLRRNETVGVGNGTVIEGTPIANGFGIILVPSARISEYRSATNWAVHSAQFRVLENFTKDGTINGELDWNKINAELEVLGA